jgi:hypothetical protein
MFKIVSGLMLLLVTLSVQALNEARLISQSSSGQTAVFNLGIHDGIQVGDYAVIVKQIYNTEKSDLKVVPVARARNIKINSDSSIWILYHIYDPELIIRGQKYSILSESNMLRGRRDLKLGRIKAVEAKAVELDDSRHLSKLDQKYLKVEHLHDQEYRSDNDFDLVDLEKWEKVRKSRYRTALYRSPYKADFQKKIRLETFEKLVTAYLQRVNDPNFNYESFYREQMRDNSNDFRKRSNFSTEYEDFLHQQSQRSVSEAKLYRSLLEKGDTWSEDFSDEELSSVLKSVSSLQESDRRAIYLRPPTRYALTLDYGLHLSDPQTDEDATYRRENRYSLGLDLEATPFLRHETLERFTLTGSVRSNNSAFEAQGFNADLNEWSATVGVNWYPLHPPYATESAAIFIGTFIRSGIAKANAPTVGEQGNYSILSYPGFTGGMRYIFRNDISLRIVASMETLNLERYESSRLGSVLPESTKVFEGKMGVGIGYSF